LEVRLSLPEGKSLHFTAPKKYFSSDRALFVFKNQSDRSSFLAWHCICYKTAEVSPILSYFPGLKELVTL
jgi:hypothetical protein